MVTEAIHSTAFNEVFHGTLVDFAFSHSLQKIFQRFERAAFLASGNHIAYQTYTNIFNSSQAKADSIPFYGKLSIGMVHIRRQHRNAHILTLGNIAGDLHGRVQHRCHQCRHVLSGIMAL